MDIDGNPLTDVIFNIDCSAMPGNDLPANRQAQSGALIFGGEERIENIFEYFRGNSSAGIRYAKSNHIRLIGVSGPGNRRGQLTPLRHAIDSVVE